MIEDKAAHSKVGRNEATAITGPFLKTDESTVTLSKAAVTSFNRSFSNISVTGLALHCFVDVDFLSFQSLL